MQQINIIFNDGIQRGSVEKLSFRLSIPSRKSEPPASTDHRHLSDSVENGVMAKDGDGAAIVLAGSEDEVHGHQKPNLGLCGRGVEAL